MCDLTLFSVLESVIFFCVLNMTSMVETSKSNYINTPVFGFVYCLLNHVM